MTWFALVMTIARLPAWLNLARSAIFTAGLNKRGDAFTDDVSDDESKAPSPHFYQIIQSSVDNPCGIRSRSDVESWDARRMLRQQTSLDFRR